MRRETFKDNNAVKPATETSSPTTSPRVTSSKKLRKKVPSILRPFDSKETLSKSGSHPVATFVSDTLFELDMESEASGVPKLKPEEKNSPTNIDLFANMSSNTKRVPPPRPPSFHPHSARLHETDSESSESKEGKKHVLHMSAQQNIVVPRRKISKDDLIRRERPHSQVRSGSWVTPFKPIITRTVSPSATLRIYR